MIDVQGDDFHIDSANTVNLGFANPAGAPVTDFDGEDRTSPVWVGADQFVTSLPGDFDSDGDVDGRDFLVWQRNQSIGELADWQANYGAGQVLVSVMIPEPPSFLLVALAIPIWLRR